MARATRRGKMPRRDHRRSAFLCLMPLALIAFGKLMAAVFVLLGVWRLVATAAPVGWWA
ncbi:hypothetical protein [Noviherbaspirillum denitrificans]|uniref:hypothetical protein n=1 Tax=Noviherbaspirillum denitrificans TaxID=1968433 RepID=UPI00148302FC|nr:hypothetical protein [Noviherbaspirillum denitrificans]